jgi:hypothetical protein
MPTTRPRLRATPAVIAFILAAVTAYVAIPRRADLTAFDPGEAARLETLMWRHYYDKRFAALFGDLYLLARDQDGFSPFDSIRIAIAAARAAKAFQPTTSRAEAQVAVPLLIDYFVVLSYGAPEPVDTMAAARAELDWWQARREQAKLDAYGLTIARVAALLYGVDDEDVRAFGVLRAQAMEFRDARGSSITEAGWAEIEQQLLAAYLHLKRAVSRRTKIG